MRKMKDRGVAWLGEIPEDWTVVFNKHLMKKVKCIREKYTGEDVLSLTMKGVLIRDLDNPSGKMPATFDGYQFVEAGNLLMCLFDIDVTPRCIGLIQNNGVCSPAYSQFKLNDLADAGYYYYYYLNLDNTKELLHLAKNLRHSLTEEQFGAIPTALPPLDVQKKISHKLERKVSEADALITNVQAQIEKLKTCKQSLITEVVTKGLDPNVPMKDSGVEWIGEIANTRSVYRLKYLLSTPLQYGANESGGKYTNDSVRYIRITDICADGSLKNDENNQYLSEKVASDYVLNDGDVLLARSGGTVGKSFLYHAEYGASAFAGYLIKADCNRDKLLPEFLVYYTQSSLYDIWKNMIFVQATIQNIGANKYSNLEIPIPPVDEQRTLVKELKVRCSKIDSLIHIKQQKIEKLEQYKRSLIYEYVTGKKEVS